ncbi:MAG: DegT/DnrJ/EryC1/StrS family aminotransferase [Spirochaetaceae bacterium]|nr:DegT/DnrJ/EryC1/StrS family aminotransferase [Spirochaetaceae bacterium]
MPEEIPFSRPFLGLEEEEAVIRVLRSRWLTTGREALAFEEEFAAFLSAPPPNPAQAGGLRALAVNSATAGLHLALEASGVGPGGVVISPSLTFTATAEVARYLGAEAAFADVKPGTYHLDPAALELCLDRLSRGFPAYAPRRGEGGEGFGPRGRPQAVMPVHYGGLSCDMEAILSICRSYGVPVIEDAAHAFPSRLSDGSFAGTLGDAGVFSFYATKPITTGEGGMVVTGNEALAKRMATMRLHGIDRPVWNRYTDSRASWYYDVVAPGYKYNLTDLQAALGRVQLGRAWELLRMREEIARRYDAAFAGVAGLSVPPTGPGDARHLYPLGLPPGLDRDGLIGKLRERGIGVSVHFIPLHTMSWYRDRYGLEPEDFPESLRSFRREVSLPIWAGMSGAQADRTAGEVLSLVR